MTDAVVHPILSDLAQHATNINPILDDIYNGSGGYQRNYSPLMLSHHWPKVARLAFMIFCTCFGSIMNGFFVASFFVEHTLKRAGYIFLACAGLADLIITSGVMSVSAVVLLSGQWDNEPVCKTVQLTMEMSTYAYSLFFVMVGAENYYRICRTPEVYNLFISMRIGLVSVFIYSISFGLAAIGVFGRLNYDYCERKYYGNISFKILTVVAFYIIPAILTIGCFTAAVIRIRRRTLVKSLYRRSRLYKQECSGLSLNIIAYILFIIAWTPYLIVVLEYPSSSDSKYYNSVWFGLLRSVFTSFLYGITDRSFRRAFAYLFNYCFCKSTLSGSITNRHRRRACGVSVHILQEGFHMTSPNRRASTSRQAREL